LRWQAARPEKDETSQTPPAPSSVLGFLGDTWRRGYDFLSHDTPFALFLVLIFAGLSLIGVYWFVNTFNRPLVSPDFVAQITATKDCQWSKAITPPTQMMQLQAGQQLQLEKGIAHITYSNGALVVLEGPVSFIVDSEKSGFLSRGKLTARADTKQLRQFTILTPDARFVDLGTEFGVMIDDKGRAAIAVFAGKVNAEAKLANGRWDAPVTLSAGEAVVCEGTKFTPQVAQRSNFPTLQPLPPPPPVPLYQRWLDASRELQTRRDLVAYYDFQPDPNNPTVLLNRALTGAALNGEIQNATWVEGRFSEKKALEFMAADAGVRVNLPGEYRQMTVIAWVSRKRLTNHFNGILMSDDFTQSKQLHLQILDSGQINMNVHGQLSKLVNGQEVQSSTKTIPTDILNGWCMIAGVIDTPDQCTLYVNGEFFETLETSQIPSIKIGPAMIGNWNRGNNPNIDYIRNFSGRIDELMIFQSVLTPEQIKHIYESGKPSNQ
ncbi:MAG: LamG-like jellyroll fold domain-containing protein, partial [Thermoguttaceae bacterium]